MGTPTRTINDKPTARKDDAFELSHAVAGCSSAVF
jgi:hypothetical protein